MFKFIVLAMVVCAANAGVIGLEHGHVAVAHVAHHAESYQNNNQISVHPVPVVAHVTHAVHAAPIAVAHAPVAVVSHGIGLGHGGLLH